MFYPMRKSLLSLTLLGSLALGGCSTIMEYIPGVYKLDIQQGNRVNQNMINQLRPNMNKRQVLYIMGSPMLVDVFHKKRWDYLYSSQLGGDDREQKRISLFFEGDTLVGVQGDFRPNNAAKATSKESTVDVPKRNLDQSLWGKTMRLLSEDELPEDEEIDEEPAGETEDSEDSEGPGFWDSLFGEDESSEQASTEALEEEAEPAVDKISDAEMPTENATEE